MCWHWLIDRNSNTQLEPRLHSYAVAGRAVFIQHVCSYAAHTGVAIYSKIYRARPKIYRGMPKLYRAIQAQ